MARTMRAALLAAAVVGVSYKAYVHRRKLLQVARKVCPPWGPLVAGHDARGD